LGNGLLAETREHIDDPIPCRDERQQSWNDALIILVLSDHIQHVQQQRAFSLGRRQGLAFTERGAAGVEPHALPAQLLQQGRKDARSARFHWNRANVRKRICPLGRRTAFQSLGKAGLVTRLSRRE